MIGEIRCIQANFSINRIDSPKSRLLNMELAGGSLLDVGIYPVFLAYALLGKPESILANSIFHKTGADIQTGLLLNYKQSTALLLSGFMADSDLTAKIYGSKGSIHVHQPWHETEGFTLITEEGSEEKIYPKVGKGYTYEILECQKCIESGKNESTFWSHNDSLALIGILDDIRNIIGLKYPFE
jgi:predicted dehydrogenase